MADRVQHRCWDCAEFLTCSDAEQGRREECDEFSPNAIYRLRTDVDALKEQVALLQQQPSPPTDAAAVRLSTLKEVEQGYRQFLCDHHRDEEFLEWLTALKEKPCQR